MRYSIFLLTTAALASAASAKPIVIKPLIDVRVRYESVDQVGRTETASALTTRVRAGFEAQLPEKFTFLADATATYAPVNDYFNGTPKSGKPAAIYPTIPDPQTIGLNRLQLQYKGITKTVVTLGRQRINLDDQRFVGSVGWRNNEQTFDAVRIETTPVKNLKADVTYAWKDNTIWGIDGTGANAGHISGDNLFATLGLTTKVGTLEGFGFVINQNNPARIQFSSQTYGARFNGKAALSKPVSLAYTLSYARQTDVKLNPRSYSADYVYGELALSVNRFTVGTGFEMLGAANGSRLKTTGALSPFALQTPLSTLHKWNGWADKFLTTPTNGLRDVYGSVGFAMPKLKPFSNLAATVIYHDYRSDVGSQHFGHEWNAQITAKYKKYNFLLKYADYSAQVFATDTRKFWASVEWAF